MVVSTWPEIAAWIAASIVSLSRHSPTMMSVGSRRIAAADERRERRQVARDLGLVHRRVGPRTRSSRNSTGAAPSTMLKLPVGSSSLATVIPAISVRFARAGAAADDDHALARAVGVEDARLDAAGLLSDGGMSAIGRSTMLPPSRRAVRVGVALRRKRSRVERSIESHRRYRIVAALQARHAVGAIEVIDDLAELVSSIARVRCTA